MSDGCLSIIVPVYSELESLPELCDSFERVVPAGQQYEIVLVNDGNIGNAIYRKLNELRRPGRVRVIHLTRNFGQHVAIAAGLKNCRGTHALVMDADLQYLPEDLYRMARHAIDGDYGAVVSVVPERQDGALKRLTSRVHYRAMSLLGLDQRPNLGSAFVVSRHVIDGLLSMHDRYRLTIPMIQWLYGAVEYFEVPHYERRHGRSGYSFIKLLNHSLHGVTGFSAKPLYLSLVVALAFGAIAFGLASYLLIRRVFYGEGFLAGWLSTTLLFMFAFSLVLGSIGIVGIYVARIFESAMGRPLYFVQDDRAAETRARIFEEP
jgi:glycosyltransferase involved in cell wall biosynthesis